MEKRGNTGAFEKAVLDGENFYVYDSAATTITAIKKNRNSLIEALPKYAAQIKVITAAMDGRLKKDEDWVNLFTALNAL